MTGTLTEYINELRAKGRTDFDMLNPEEKAEFNKRLKELHGEQRR